MVLKSNLGIWVKPVPSTNLSTMAPQDIDINDQKYVITPVLFMYFIIQSTRLCAIDIVVIDCFDNDDGDYLENNRFQYYKI